MNKQIYIYIYINKKKRKKKKGGKKWDVWGNEKKKLKKMAGKMELDLIEETNPTWDDLYDSLS